MNRFFTIVLLLAYLYAVPALAEGEAPLMTIQEAVQRVVELSPDVLVQRSNPAQAETEYRKSRAIYDPHLFLQALYTDSQTIDSLTTIGSALETKRTEMAIEGGITQLFSSGATATLGLAGSRTSFDVSRNTDSFWETVLSLEVSQPLLKNFGVEATELVIRSAQYGSKRSHAQFVTSLMDSVLGVVSEYYQLVNLRELVQVRKSSLALANKILEDTKGRVNAGVLPAMEILNAEFGLSTRERELIDAERSVSDRYDSLAYLVQSEEAFRVASLESLPTVTLEDNEETAVAMALEIRPELQDQEVAVAASELQERVARNRKLPDLSVIASASLQGLADSSSRVVDQIGGADNPGWSLGARLSYPLGNGEAVNEHSRTRLVLDQNRVRLQGLKERIVNEVRSAWRELAARIKQQEVAQRGKAYAEERFRAFQKRNEVGLATTRDLLDVEQELALARSNLIAARTDSAVASYRLRRATGQILAREGIEVESFEGAHQLERVR
jgi:outer membrane protein TolC